MKGRYPASTKLKLLKGTQPSRINKGEPKPRSTSGSIPSGWARSMSMAARTFWKRHAQELAELGVLTEVDLPAFRVLCEIYSMWMKCIDTIHKKGMSYECSTKAGGKMMRARPEVNLANEMEAQYLRYAAQFGLTPAARGRISVSPPTGDEEDLD